MSKMPIDDERHPKYDEQSAADLSYRTDDDETHSIKPDFEMRQIAKEETRRINCFRWLVMAIILSVGAALSVFTYRILDQQVEEDTQDALNLFASTIEQNWKFRVSTIFSANRALSRAITTSESTSTTNRFPHFSIPAWEAKAYEARIQAGFEVVMYAPVTVSRDRWLDFAQETRDWLDESKNIYDQLEPGKDRSSEPPTGPLADVVWDFAEDGEDGEWEFVERERDGLMATTLHVSPPPLQSVSTYQNINMFSNDDYDAASKACIILKDAVFTGFNDVLVGLVDNMIGDEDHQAAHLTDRKLYPHSIAAQPVYRGLGQDTDDVVGYIYSVVAWDRYLLNLLPEEVVGINVVLRNSCGQAVTFELSGVEATVIADSDIHEDDFESPVVSLDFAENYFDPSLTSDVEGHCQVFLDVYSSAAFQESYESFLPVGMAIMVSSLFVLMAASFGLYDWFVWNRNEKVVGVAARSNAIVSNLFPTNVKERLMEEQLEKQKAKSQPKPGTDENLLGFLSDRESGGLSSLPNSKPIADFYPETTILFADLAGFTSWASGREPADVFVLLETIYHEFDSLAKRRKIFKVETIGDCYIAVAGLPTPRKDHAIALCRFAKECMYATWKLTAELSKSLGPDTEVLTMRMGIHSGPVTGGVLRGDKGRFALFGDTMNTASRMESNGTKSRIQISQATADELLKFGKSRWFCPREDKVKAKGKGELQTYWLNVNHDSETGTTSSEHSDSNADFMGHSERGRVDAISLRSADEDKVSRLVSCNVEMMANQLKEIVASRNTKCKVERGATGVEMAPLPVNDSYDGSDPSSIELDPKVMMQLTTYVSMVASMYNNDNPFHNFEHSTHMTMSVVKLLSRMEGPKREESLSHNSYDITTDHLAQFACLLSALIHDVDHPGMYKMVEQDSFNRAWDLLFRDDYEHLRSTIYATEAEKQRLKELVIGCMMTLRARRVARWNKEFRGQSLGQDAGNEGGSKQTIVINYLIQASDMAHTMQHWQVFTCWNEKLFCEVYQAYKDGRIEQDPSKVWYEEELGFFRHSVIPLAKKLKEIGVFGVSSGVFLSYAEQNMAKWSENGRRVVSDMMNKQHEDTVAAMVERETLLRSQSVPPLVSSASSSYRSST